MNRSGLNLVHGPVCEIEVFDVDRSVQQELVQSCEIGAGLRAPSDLKAHRLRKVLRLASVMRRNSGTTSSVEYDTPVASWCSRDCSPRAWKSAWTSRFSIALRKVDSTKLDRVSPERSCDSSLARNSDSTRIDAMLEVFILPK
jgi:hypothetical protein